MLKENIKIIDFEQILKNSKLKITPTRIAVLETLLKNDKPICADYISKKLSGKINEATVYRILSLLEQNEIIKKIDFKKDCAYFELNNDHHHHIICVKCGLVEDFKESKEVEKLLEKVVGESKKFKKIKEHSLELFGYCKVCN